MKISVSLWISDEEMEQIINDSFFESVDFLYSNDDFIGGYLYRINYQDGSFEYVNCESRFFV